MIQYYPYGIATPFRPVKQYIGADPFFLSNVVFSAQKKPNLCWAASIEMILKYYGLNINQYEFAQKYCGVDLWGNAKDCPASVDVITESMNRCFRTHCIGATALYGTPDLDTLFALIQTKQPVIIAYSQGPNQVGHAVLLTGMSFIKKGNINEIQSIVVRDPDPDVFNQIARGRKEYHDPADFLSRIYAWWVPAVSKYDCPVCVH